MINLRCLFKGHVFAIYPDRHSSVTGSHLICMCCGKHLRLWDVDSTTRVSDRGSEADDEQ